MRYSDEACLVYGKQTVLVTVPQSLSNFNFNCFFKKHRGFRPKITYQATLDQKFSEAEGFLHLGSMFFQD